MSTLKTTNLQNPSAANPAFVLAADGSATASLSSVNGGPIAGTRNRIINGDMRIDQRNAGASVSVNNLAAYSVDRWTVEDGSDAILSAQQTTDVPTGQGFTNSLRVTVTTADASIGASQFDGITQIIEGFNCSDLGWGGAGATSVTASFWVKASVAGQYSCTVYNNGGSRSNPQSFTINSANTWEKKTITFEGDTAGTWLATNGRGIVFNVYLAMGSSFLGSAGWNGSSIFGVTGQANAVSTVNNTFYLTGVQLEPGTVATPFERRSYGAELALCQRYYWQNTQPIRLEGHNGYGNSTWLYVSNPTTMRAAPTASNNWTVLSVATGNINNIGVHGFQVYIIPTAGNLYYGTYGSGNTFSAEL
jgi:hypothetical protein